MNFERNNAPSACISNVAQAILPVFHKPQAGLPVLPSTLKYPGLLRICPFTKGELAAADAEPISHDIVSAQAASNSPFVKGQMRSNRGISAFFLSHTFGQTKTKIGEKQNAN